MRLLHSETLQIHEFTDHEIPEYAILSHRWEKDEVTFHDMETGGGPEQGGLLEDTTVWRAGRQGRTGVLLD